MRKNFIRRILMIVMSIAMLANYSGVGSIAFAAEETVEETAVVTEEISEEIQEDFEVENIQLNNTCPVEVYDDSEYAIMPLYMQVYDSPVKNWYYDMWFNASNCKNYADRYSIANGNSHDGYCAAFAYYEYFRVLKELGLCEDIYTGDPDVKSSDELASLLDADSNHWKVVYDEPADDEQTCIASFYDAVKKGTIQAGDVVFFYETNATNFWHVSILGADLSTDGNSIYMVWQSNGNGPNNSKVGSVGFDYVVEAQGNGYIEGYGFKVYRLEESVSLPTPQITNVENVSNGMKIDWNAVSGAEKYRVYYKTSTGWTRIAETTSNSYTWTGANSGTTYTFTIRCVNSDGQFTSDFDPIGKTLTYIAAPKLTEVVNAGGGIKISWEKSDGADIYCVYYKNGTGWTRFAETTSTSYIWTGAESGRSYTFTVRCVSSDGKVFTSDFDHAGKTFSYEAAPKLTEAVNVNGGVRINWEELEGADIYCIYYKNETGWTRFAETTSTSYTWNGATSGTTYTFTVRCISSDGKIFTSDFDHEGMTLTYVAAPKISGVSNGNNEVKLSWDKVTGAEKYRVFYRMSVNSSWTKIADTTSTSYTWTGAENGQTYIFTVRCLSDDGKTYTSSYDSKGISITVGMLDTPTISSVSNVDSGVKLSWDKVDGAEQYRVFYRMSVNSSWTKIADTATTSYTWTGAESGNTYIFTVRCLSADGKSYTSSYDSKGKSITVGTLATPAISNVSNTNNGVVINWDNVNGAEKYRIFYRTSPNSSWTKIADTTSTSYTWTGAESGNTYIFTVRCLSADGKTYTSSYDAAGKTITISK